MGTEKKHVRNDNQLQQVLRMNGGDHGDNSYANNSLLQKKVMLKAKPILQESIVELYCSSFPDCITLADMGCSSGPNTFLPLWEIIEAIDEICKRLNRKPPELQLFLNDLPQNDFNSIFRSLPSFRKELAEEKGDKFGRCYIAAMPGSFYGRLFPPRSLHFVHSSYSLHWCSKVPKGLMDEYGIALNKGNIYIAKTSPPSVHKAYLNQFGKDFTTFLRSRSEEMISGGRMVLTILGRESSYASIWELFGLMIKDMVSDGLIEESKLDSFNMPFFMPCAEEVESVIQNEGSFSIHQLEKIQIPWDASVDDTKEGLVLGKYGKGKFVTNRMRAVAEPVLTSHFGDAIVDVMFQKFSIVITDYMETVAMGSNTNLVVSMIHKK